MTMLPNTFIDILAAHRDRIKSANFTMRADGSWYITIETKSTDADIDKLASDLVAAGESEYRGQRGSDE